jgi:hypothetical protein
MRLTAVELPALFGLNNARRWVRKYAKAMMQKTSLGVGIFAFLVKIRRPRWLSGDAVQW